MGGLFVFGVLVLLVGFVCWWVWVWVIFWFVCYVWDCMVVCWVGSIVGVGYVRFRVVGFGLSVLGGLVCWCCLGE